MINYSDYSIETIEDIARLRRRIDASGIPQKILDRNLLIGTWNIRLFGDVYRDWNENPGSPKRNLRALACIAEIIRRMDVVAIQEVKRDTAGLRLLVEQFLGPNWGLILSDVTAGSAGNTERLAFIYDVRRITPSGLVGEIVLPPTSNGDPQDQFARTPFIAGFKSGGQNFVLLSAHIKYGTIPEDRLAEIQSLATYVAVEIRDRANIPGSEEKNLIVLGDFNIDKRGDNPLFQAFVSTGLKIPPLLNDLRTTLNTDPKYYDQIGWFMDQDFELRYSEHAGVIDFVGAIFKEIRAGSMTYRISDHFPLWVEFHTDRSVEQMALKLGLEEHQTAMPDPLRVVPD